MISATKNDKLAVVEWGEGPVILCVHGWSNRGLRFSPLIEVLADAGYRLVTFDAPAHGRSQGATSISWRMWAL
jgi:pimeloyl-ACP methyl ester carboxylesterase